MWIAYKSVCATGVTAICVDIIRLMTVTEAANHTVYDYVVLSEMNAVPV